MIPESPTTLDLAPALTIEISIGTTCDITVWEKDQKTPVMSLTNPALSQAKLGRLREEVRERVGRFCRTLTGALNTKDPRVDLREGMAALFELHEAGYYILQLLLGEEARAKLPLLRQLARDACTGWSDPGWNGLTVRPNLVVVKTSVDYGIPIDLLPLLDFEPPRPSDSREDLGRLACSFLGFSAIVKRQLGNAVATAGPIENIPKLPMKMFVNRSLHGARQEEAAFRSNRHIDVDSGWPNTAEPRQVDFPRTLANYLWEIDTRFGKGARNIPDQICHFSCHSSTGLNVLPSNYEIKLHSGNPAGGRTVNLLSLTNELSRLGMTDCEDRRPRPLIFFNSCGSGDLDPAGSGSFPELFLKRDLGFKGFIGTETSIPDDFAAEFSKRFYDNLLGGFAVGHALWLTRWQLLSLYQNPLGLLYTLFAEPEIGVRRPVAQDLLMTTPSRGLGTQRRGLLDRLRRIAKLDGPF